VRRVMKENSLWACAASCAPCPERLSLEGRLAQQLRQRACVGGTGVVGPAEMQAGMRAAASAAEGACASAAQAPGLPASSAKARSHGLEALRAELRAAEALVKHLSRMVCPPPLSQQFACSCDASLLVPAAASGSDG
jgi:hypothetical protein